MKKIMLCVLAVILLLHPSMPVAAAELPCDNPVDVKFTCVDGGEISTQCSGKPKVLVFYQSSCSNCIRTLRDFSASEWIQDGKVEVCAIDFMTTDVTAVEKFRDDNCPEGTIRFGLDQAGNAFLTVYDYKEAGGYIGGGTGTPLVAMLDADNQLRFVTMGQIITSAQMEETYLPVLCPEEGGDPGDAEDPDPKPGDDDTEDPAPGPGDDDTENPDPGEDDTEDPNPGPGEDDTEDPNPGPGEDDTEDPNPGPGEDDTEEPELPPGETEPEKIEQGNGNKTCSHVEESVLLRAATASEDSVMVYQCAKCGAFLRQETVNNSAFAVFLKNAEDAILNAAQKEVVIDTRIWLSFNKKVFEAMKSRPDVTVTVNYFYEGTEYTLKIPAGTDVDTLMDENGFGGFRYIEQVLNAED